MNIALFPEASLVIDEKGLDEWDDGLPLNGFKPKLLYKKNSLIFHKVQAVTVTSKDEPYSLPHTADKVVRNRL